jgi:hypothetical protein
MTDMRKTRLPSIFTGFESGMDGVDKDQMQKIELRARIQRLKENGWKRVRFNGERYQKLCENALEELE